MAGTKSGFSAAEREAMKARAEELAASGRGGKKKAEEAQACLEAIEKMPDDDRRLAERIHAIVIEVAPTLRPKTWYGMPAYANEDGKVVVFFQDAGKFDYRYATLGFQDTANIDDGDDLYPEPTSMFDPATHTDLVDDMAPLPNAHSAS